MNGFIAGSVNSLKANLGSAGVGLGSVLLLHSGMGNLRFRGSANFVDQIQYSQAVVSMLKDLVGPEGTILMSTDSVANPGEFAYARRVFESDRMRSRRGIISEVFRLSEGVVRSRHPWCNASAWGKYANWLIKDHLESKPFAMDRNSPWFKLLEIDAHIVYFGVNPENASITSVLPEYVMGYDYPVGANYDKPLVLKYRTVDGLVENMPTLVHVHDWRKAEMTKFFLYLDSAYGLHSRHGIGAEHIITCRAKKQFDVLSRELEIGHAFIHVRYWL
jgi:aminoglycoside N3'-acetyltransferase